jgi:hypothetical protein
VAGRQTRIVELSPRGREGVVQRLWLDRETSFVLKRERYNAGGRVTAGTEYLEVAFGSSVPAGAFAVPPDWRRVGPDGRGPRLTLAELGRKAGFAVRAPQYVPPGYELLGGYVAEGGRWHVRMAELRYTDGLRVLSVFERARESMDSGRGMGPPGRGRGRALGRGRRGRAPERGRGRGGGFGPPDGREITLMDRGSEKALRYFGSELVIVVVGDLTAEELTRIAKSVG